MIDARQLVPLMPKHGRQRPNPAHWPVDWPQIARPLSVVMPLAQVQPYA